MLSPGEGGDLTSGTSETTSNFGGGSGAAEPGLSVASQLQKDAFLVFRALCKLSIRSADAAPGSELTTIRGKVRGQQAFRAIIQSSRHWGQSSLSSLTTKVQCSNSGVEEHLARAPWHVQVLALQLLKILLENSGPVFHSTERFITAIKQYLCLSLLKNCASQYPQVQMVAAAGGHPNCVVCGQSVRSRDFEQRAPSFDIAG